jgi:hypothetical protein
MLARGLIGTVSSSNGARRARKLSHARRLRQVDCCAFARRGGWPHAKATRGAIAATAALALGAIAPAAASAASPPRVATGPPQAVSFASATLTGTVTPRGQDTTYFFQYGTTKAYGSQTALADAGAGSAGVHVRLAVTGLAPVTKYHFRLIAVNASGASTGGDGFFTTKKVPLSLAILVAPNPVEFGGTAFVEGALSGTGSGGAAVQLQANVFPYLGGFVNLGNSEVTMPNGSFSFPVLNMSTVTQFRVVTSGAHRIVSATAMENVAVRVTSHVGRARRRHFARVYGTVAPAEDGAQVAILRITHGRGVLVAGTTLHHLNTASSSFSRAVRVRAGAYRVLVRVTSGAQISNYGRTLIIR